MFFEGKVDFVGVGECSGIAGLGEVRNFWGGVPKKNCSGVRLFKESR
jgi:hypothetical protein